ncbi:MAG: prenyltransferase/squalene oxidase repeat-containing protein [Promethearchaeia archaeon]
MIIKLSRTGKRRLKNFIILFLLIGTPILTLILVNTRFISYIDEESVAYIKRNAAYFTKSHQNDDGLFLEPNIYTNFRAIDSINFTHVNNTDSRLINPNNLRNDLIKKLSPNFFFDYIFEKQNINGAYSDIGGLGNMISTYEAIKTIEVANKSYLSRKIMENKTTEIINYLNDSLNGNGWGFRVVPFLNYSDIISTSYAIELAQILSGISILNNENISKYINSTWVITGGYTLTDFSLIPTPETTYHGIKAYIGMNMTYNIASESALLFYISSLYNIDGGFRNNLGVISDIESTYYCLASLDLLNLTIEPLFNETNTLDFILNCSNPDGGFGQHPVFTTPSDFNYGWAAMKALSILEKSYTFTPSIENRINEIKLNYYNWLHDHQALNSLFGHITLEYNYFGVLALRNYNPENLYGWINETQAENILVYVYNCYNIEDGGFGSRPDLNSTLFSTYCALNLINFINPYELNQFHEQNKSITINYLVGLQNPDGGFRIGNDVDFLLSLFGPYYNFFLNLINTNVSTVESTYWALISLDILQSSHLIDRNNLSHWIKSCQNPDGGFSIFIGFHSDIVSTYFGLEIFNQFFSTEPMSKVAVIEFLKLAQMPDGSFSLLPAIGQYIELPSTFLVTYLASKALYDYRFQPEDIQGALNWYRECISEKTGGFGDNPGFGGDLRNAAYGIVIIDELKHDQTFDSKPWNEMLFYILIFELIGFGLFILLKLYQRLSIPQRIKLLFGIGEKLTPSYLQQFPAINCENFSVYAGGTLIVDSVSMSISHGKILGILGESGAGKSTFIKGLLGMRKTTGFCQIYGMNMSKRTAKRIRPIYGYVPQDLGKLYHNFTTLENLLYFGNQYGLTEKEIISKSKRILRSLDIEDKMHELVKNLSGGEKRRVSIAIGLIHSPIFLILDEPTSGLDPIIRESLWLTLTKINEQFKTTLVVITHYPEESRFCNDVAIFGRKRGMIDFGKPKELLDQLPGKGRSVELQFFKPIENAIESLESIEGVEKVLENKVGTNFSIFTNLNVNELFYKIENVIGSDSVQLLKQIDSKMEQFFRYKAMEVPKIEEL